MYAPTDFQSPDDPQKARPPMQRERLWGLAMMLVFIFMCLLSSLNADAELFNPANTDRARTQVGRTLTPTRTTPPTATQPAVDQAVTSPQEGQGTPCLAPKNLDLLNPLAPAITPTACGTP